MAKKKEVRLKKIPLAIFLEALEELYEFGLEYIDIIGVPGEEQDTIGIMYSKEYMNPEITENLDEAMDRFVKDYGEDKENKIDIKLSDDDLNQLI